jgi:hypothetical protein
MAKYQLSSSTTLFNSNELALARVFNENGSAIGCRRTRSQHRRNSLGLWGGELTVLWFTGDRASGSGHEDCSDTCQYAS